MKQVELTILEEDVREGKYMNRHDCPITRALKRADIDAQHTGLTIKENKTGRILANNNTPGFRCLSDTVCSMDSWLKEPDLYKDFEPTTFTVKLNLNIDEEETVTV